MKIYTKTGDKGTTALLNGKRVSKHHLRIDTYGEVDSLNSYIGLSISHAKIELSDSSELITNPLTTIQHILFNIGSHLACDTEPTTFKLPEIKATYILELENQMDEWNKELTPLKEFILPGGCLTASSLNIARTNCRKCERLVSKLSDEENVDQVIFIYLNRLSDYLFTMARYANHLAKTAEVIWKKEFL